MSNTYDAELAQANLFRMRADFRRAEDICLHILKNNPKSAATHSLLGDIYCDKGQLEQSAQWYGLSLDLDPSSLADKQKLADVIDQIRERDHISSAAQLGLPDSPKAGYSWKFAGAAVVIIMAAVLGYAIRFGKIGNYVEPQVVQTPIRATPETVVPVILSTAGKSPRGGLAVVGSNLPPDHTATPMVYPKDDHELTEEVVAKSKYGVRLISLAQDLKTKITTVTYSSVEGEDVRVVGADLAKTIFELTEDPETVMLRAFKGKKPVYQAEVPRDLYAETLTDDWQQKATVPDAWVSYILTNELWEKALNAQAAKNDAADDSTTTAASDKSSDKSASTTGTTGSEESAKTTGSGE